MPQRPSRRTTPRRLPFGLLLFAALYPLASCGGGDGVVAPEPEDPAGEAGSWRALANLPEPADFLGGAVLGGRIYAVGGSLGVRGYRYDPGTNVWTRLPDLPGAVHAAAVRTDTLLAVGSTAVYAWNPDDESWSVYGGLPQWAEAPLVAGGSAGMLLARLGTQAETPSDTAFFLPAGASAWRQAARVPFQGQTARLQNLSPGGGGIWGIGLESISRYLPETDRWEAPVLTGASARFGCGVATDSRVHHFTWPATLAVHLVYDVGSGVWSSATPPPDGQRWGPLCLAIGERVYFIGGNDVTGFNPRSSVHVFEW